MAEKDKEAYSEMTVAELKKILKSKKLPISGSKQKLIERLINPNWKEKERSEKALKERPYRWLENLAAFVVFLFMYIYAVVDKTYKEHTQDMVKCGYTIYEPPYPCRDITDFSVNEVVEVFIIEPWPLLLLFGIILAYIFMIDTKYEESATNIALALVFIGVAALFFGLVSIYGESNAFNAIISVGVCTSILMIVIVFLAISNTESLLEAAAGTWLLLTILGAIVSIIIYIILLSNF
mgnify:CR=1 FL=1